MTGYGVPEIGLKIASIIFVFFARILSLLGTKRLNQAVDSLLASLFCKNMLNIGGCRWCPLSCLINEQACDASLTLTIEIDRKMRGKKVYIILT
jgi:hypothetical protein